jgi:hypothetical protein
MRWNRAILIVSLLTLCCALPSYAQKSRNPDKKFRENHSPFGKKKKEKHNQHAKRGGGLFRKGRSKGNADAFASHSISGRRGFISRMFHGSGSGAPKNASLRKTKPGKTQNKEQAGLFKRNRTKNKNYHANIQRSQKRDRDKRRVRGNSVFHKKRH